MNHKHSFTNRLVLLMLLLALPVLACNALSGNEEDGETAITEDEVGKATATDVPEEATDREDESVDESSTAVANLELDSDDAAVEATETAIPEATGRENSTDDASSDGSEESDEGSDGSNGETAARGSDQDSSTTDGATGDGWGDSGSGPQSACDHPYLPLRMGATWTYTDGQNDLIWEVTEVVGDLNNATAVLRITVEDTFIDYHWSCESGSGMASFDFANVSSSAVGIELTLDQVEADGQFLLPADQLQPGATWETRLESPISFTQGVDDAQLVATGNMITVQKNQVISADPVTFDGLTVPGVQIEQTDDISLDLSILGASVSQNMSLTNMNNLGRGIGMVSQNSISDFGTTTTQLVSYSIP